MATQELEKIIECMDKMPSLSPTATKIVQLANNPTSSPKDLTRVIAMDPALTMRILKLINSAYFGVSTKVTSIVRAIVMLGLNTIKNLALSTAIVATLKKKQEKSFFDMDKFWLHSLGCAVAAKSIAVKMKVIKDEREEYFIAGLIHDIGKLVFDYEMPKKFEKVIDQLKIREIPISFIEQRVIGSDHAEVGAMLCKKWNLSSVLIESIKYHHEPLEKTENPKLTAAIHLADAVVKTRKIGFSGDVVVELEPDIWNILELEETPLEEFLPNLEENINKSKTFIK